jgi:MerR family transcriptional regulator, light-induced transcriptional regulator
MIKEGENMNSRELSDFIKTRKSNLTEKIAMQDPNFALSTPKYKEKYLQDTLYTLTFLTNALYYDHPALFKNYMIWFGRFAQSHQFSESRFLKHMDAMKIILDSVVPGDAIEMINEYLESGIVEFTAAFSGTETIDSEIDPFLDDLIQMRSDKASKYIMERLENGMGIESIYLDILQPTLYKVGLLWQKGIIGVAKEHYITAAIQHIIGQLYPYLFQKRGISRYSLTAVCAGTELHEIGMRMVADFFELAGWDTYFLGSNLPPEMIVSQLKAQPS